MRKIFIILFLILLIVTLYLPEFIYNDIVVNGSNSAFLYLNPNKQKKTIINSSPNAYVKRPEDYKIYNIYNLSIRLPVLQKDKEVYPLDKAVKKKEIGVKIVDKISQEIILVNLKKKKNFINNLEDKIFNIHIFKEFINNKDYSEIILDIFLLKREKITLKKSNFFSFKKIKSIFKNLVYNLYIYKQRETLLGNVDEIFPISKLEYITVNNLSLKRYYFSNNSYISTSIKHEGKAPLSTYLYMFGKIQKNTVSTFFIKKFYKSIKKRKMIKKFYFETLIDYYFLLNYHNYSYKVFSEWIYYLNHFDKSNILIKKIFMLTYPMYSKDSNELLNKFKEEVVLSAPFKRISKEVLIKTKLIKKKQEVKIIENVKIIE